MSSPSSDGLKQEIDAGRLRIGNQVQEQTGAPATTGSLPLYVDANKNLKNGGFPFMLPLLGGTLSTSTSIASIQGSSTLTANDIMHQTLVAGAGVTTFTSGGFIRVTVTDDAGNIVNGDYYIQFGTLT